MSEAEDKSQIPAEAHIEQQKECLNPPEKAVPEQFFEHGESNKMPDDAVPAQSMMNNSTIDGRGVQSELVKSRTRASRLCRSAQQNEYLTPEKSATKSEAVGETSKMETDVPDDKSNSTDNLQYVVLALKSYGEGYAGKQSRATHSRTELKPAVIHGITSSRSSGRRYRNTPETKIDGEKYALRSSTGKGQRSSIQEKPAAPEPDSNMKNASSGRKRGRKKGQKNGVHDEFSRMRIHLRYLLRRIGCEQNLLDAYCSEGWRGQSLEKLRPEKELEHAKLNINRTKLKIRGLFQRLDAICAEGRFPETLFDSEGLIDSEDIFCAKCGCRDLSPNNDIILCDGACDRGFHQLCLDPPLRTEEIPPGDEGWYCPACDCKFDCVELLNDSMGTKLSIEGSWENVFPEAEAKASGQDDINGLPSDDSEDNDYNPNGIDDDDDVGGGDDDDSDDMEGGESTSDESDFSSASEDLGAIHNNDDQYLGLPSDDSEDDDFDPNIVDAEDQPKQEDSSSGFTSASENLNAVIENDEISSEDKHPNSPSKLVEDLDDSVLVCERRQLERLDYKKLYDETYGNASTDSSDDEEWNDAITPEKSKKNGGKNTSTHSSEGEEWKDRVTPKRRRYGPRNASTPTTTHDIPVAAGRLSNVVRNTSTTGNSPLCPKVGVSNDLQTPETNTGFQTSKRQPYARLGEEVIQRLSASFKENQYPDHTTKNKLAEELGLTPKKISKWFEYARWSTNHSTVAKSSTSKVTPRRGRKAAKSFHEKDSSASGDVASNGVDKAPLDANKNLEPNSHTNPSKRKLDAGETSATQPVRRSARRKNSGKQLVSVRES